MREQGHTVSQRVVANLLRTLEYSLQGNRKVLEGSQHPDRNAQFEYLNAQVEAQLAVGEPAISVDAKKKELVGPFKNGGRELRPKGHPEPVRVHDFVDKELGRATPYGVYDLAQNQGWVTVGIDHDTAEFAVASIARWWQSLGQAAYPNATSLLITADGGGSNGVTVTPVEAGVAAPRRTRPGWSCGSATCHPAPANGTRSSIGSSRTSPRTGAGKPLVSYEVIVQLIAATTTKSGLAGTL